MSSSNLNKETINDMVSRVLGEHEVWSKHLAHTCCRCEKCTCGKHLCKFETTGIKLKPTNSEYAHEYTKKKGSMGRSQSNSRIVVPSDDYHPNQFIEKSEYKQEYNKKKGNGERAKASPHKDNLSSSGPTFLNTTYQNNFTPQKIERVEVIKNPENLGNTPAKMNTKSNYKTSYGGNYGKNWGRQEPIRPSDNLGLRSSSINFMGKTSYGSDYTKYPNFQSSSNFGPNQRYNPTHGLTPTTSYKCDYRKQPLEPCPATKCPKNCC